MLIKGLPCLNGAAHGRAIYKKGGILREGPIRHSSDRQSPMITMTGPYNALTGSHRLPCFQRALPITNYYSSIAHI